MSPAALTFSKQASGAGLAPAWKRLTWLIPVEPGSPSYPMPTTQLFVFCDGLSMGNFCCLLQASKAGEEAPQTLAPLMGMEGTTALRRVNNSRMPQNFACSKDNVFRCK